MGYLWSIDNLGVLCIDLIILLPKVQYISLTRIFQPMCMKICFESKVARQEMIKAWGTDGYSDDLMSITKCHWARTIEIAGITMVGD